MFCCRKKKGMKNKTPVKVVDKTPPVVKQPDPIETPSPPQNKKTNCTIDRTAFMLEETNRNEEEKSPPSVKEATREEPGNESTETEQKKARKNSLNPVSPFRRKKKTDTTETEKTISGVKSEEKPKKKEITSKEPDNESTESETNKAERPVLTPSLPFNRKRKSNRTEKTRTENTTGETKSEEKPKEGFRKRFGKASKSRNSAILDRTTSHFSAEENYLEGFKMSAQLPLIHFGLKNGVEGRNEKLTILILQKKIELPEFDMTFVDEKASIKIIKRYPKTAAKVYVCKEEKRVDYIDFVYEYTRQSWMKCKLFPLSFELRIKTYDGDGDLFSHQFFNSGAMDKCHDIKINNMTEVRPQFPGNGFFKVGRNRLKLILKGIHIFNDINLNSLHFENLFVESECDVTPNGIYQFINNWAKKTEAAGVGVHLKLVVTTEFRTEFLKNLKDQVLKAVCMADDRKMEDIVMKFYNKLAVYLKEECGAFTEQRFLHDNPYHTVFDSNEVYYVCRLVNSLDGAKKLVKKKYVATIGFKDHVFEFCNCGDVNEKLEEENFSPVDRALSMFTKKKKRAI